MFRFAKHACVALLLVLLSGCASGPWRAAAPADAAPAARAVPVASADAAREARLADLERFFVFENNGIRPVAAARPTVYRPAREAPPAPDARPLFTRVAAPPQPAMATPVEADAPPPAASRDDGPVTALVAPPLPEPVLDTVPVLAPEPVAVAAPQVYTVQGGDTLWDIARAHLGSGARWTEIAAANPGLANPDRIFPGQHLTLPAA